MHLLKVSLIGEMATDGYSLITEPLIFPSQDSPFYFFYQSILGLEQSYLITSKTPALS